MIKGKSIEYIGKNQRIDWRTLPYQSTYLPDNQKRLDITHVTQWMRSNVGGKGVEWDYAWRRYEEGLTKYIDLVWRFKNKEDKMLFDLTWILND